MSSPSRWVMWPVESQKRLLCIPCSWVKHRRLGTFRLHKGHKREYPPSNRWSSPSVFQVHKPLQRPKGMIFANHRLLRLSLIYQPPAIVKKREKLVGDIELEPRVRQKYSWILQEFKKFEPFPPATTCHMSFWQIFAEIFWQKLLSKKKSCLAVNLVGDIPVVRELLQDSIVETKTWTTLTFIRNPRLPQISIVPEPRASHIPPRFLGVIQSFVQMVPQHIVHFGNGQIHQIGKAFHDRSQSIEIPWSNRIDGRTVSFGQHVPHRPFLCFVGGIF